VRQQAKDPLGEGKKRYRKSLQAPAYYSELGKDFLHGYLKQLTSEVEEEQRRLAQQATKKGRPQVHSDVFLAEEPCFLALAALDHVFRTVSSSLADTEGGPWPSVQRVSRAIAEDVERSRTLRHLRSADEREHKKLCRGLKSKYRMTRQRANVRLRIISRERWKCDSVEKRACFHAAGILIGLVRKTRAIELFNHRELTCGGPRTPKLVRFSDDVLHMLRGHRKYIPVIYMPTFRKPIPWKALEGGGYHDVELDMVKHWDNPSILQALEGADLRAVRRAINALQETPWQINEDVYRVMETQFRDERYLAGLPEEPQNQRQREKREHYLEHVIPLRLQLASELIGRRFYFPYQIDFRGRAYAVPQVFNPQSDDIGRALLRFATGKPLGEEGAEWLAIYLASMWGRNGVDKKSFQDRCNWVTNNTDLILATATKKTRTWMEADKPWRFLAACLEWKGYLEIGSAFLSHLPIAMDGTCNGLQHLSAIARDSLVAEATNLKSSKEPMDIYLTVAGCVERELLKRTAEGDSNAERWLKKAGRKMVKGATMTKPYGVTLDGIGDQLLEDGFASSKSEARELAKLISDCIDNQITQPVMIMKWLSKIAWKLALRNRRVTWLTPLGLPVVQERHKKSTLYIQTTIGKMRLNDRDPALGLDEYAQANAIVANLVQSLDAAHMMATVNNLRENGFRHFEMVHDSYAVHACDVNVMNGALRQEFVRLHQKEVLKDFLSQQRAANPDIELPEPPVLGTLDITVVLNSPYFFS